MGSHDHPADARSARATRTPWPLLGLLYLGIAAIYLFFVTAGTGTRIPAQSDYFTVLADGFLDGHLHISIPPSPELLAKADPYDHANSRLWLWDVTLHDGRYYLYWGPVPALLAAAVKSVAGRDLRVGDEMLTLAFVLGRLALGMAILVLARRRLFPRIHPWSVAPAIVLFALANPVLFGLCRAAVYEAAIEGAQCFLLAGLLLGWLSIANAGPRRSQLMLSSLAGCAWGAALACRISLVLAIGALVLSTAGIACLGAERPRREAALRLVWIGAPVAFAGFLLCLYNYARFGSWTDFGAAHQLGFIPYSFSLVRFLPNLHAYLLRDVLISCRFPFVEAPYEAWALTPTWVFAQQTGYAPLEPTVGMLIAVPWVVFGAVAVWTASRFVLGRARSGSPPAIDPRNRLYLWLVSACLSILLLAGVPALGMQFSTMRFLSDFTSAALVLAPIGYWTLSSGAKSAGRRRAVQLAGVLLGLYTLVFSSLLGFQGGYYEIFEHGNPALHQQLVKSLSLCERRGNRPAAQPAR